MYLELLRSAAIGLLVGGILVLAAEPLYLYVAVRPAALVVLATKRKFVVYAVEFARVIGNVPSLPEGA